ncbi:MAG: SMC-Scp complex subunit ScpB [Candidatus Micrarchaeota archaeon]
MSDEKKMIEAALFLSSRAMGVEEFKTLTGIGAVGYLQNAIQELKKDYEERGSAIEISEVDGKYVMKIKGEHIEKVKQFAKETEISKNALRTLAYLSKHNEMLKSDLVKKIGPQIYDDVRELVENGFIRQRKEGRTSKLTLTEKFKTYFEV